MILPKELAKTLPKSRLLTESEWRGIGVQQSRGWQHYAIHRYVLGYDIHFGQTSGMHLNMLVPCHSSDPSPISFYSVVLWALTHKVAASIPSCNARLVKNTAHNMAYESKSNTLLHQKSVDVCGANEQITIEIFPLRVWIESLQDNMGALSNQIVDEMQHSFCVSLELRYR